MAHTNAIFSPPGNGGILLEEADGRLPHRPRPEVQLDDEPPVHLQQARSARGRRSLGGTTPASSPASVGSIDDALALTGDQQAAIGFFCGSTVATRDAPITSCASGGGATRLRIPADGTEDDVTNPPRIAPRHLFDLGLGVDNLFHGEQGEGQAAVQRREPDEQGRALQLPVDVQRHALRDAARVSVPGRRGLLRDARPVSLIAAVAALAFLTMSRPIAQEGSQIRECAVLADDFKFTLARVDVHQNEIVRVTFRAVDIPHTFTIDYYRIAKRAGVGQTIVFEFRADRAGTFPIYCSLTADQRCRQMKGQLVVVPGDGAGQ